MINGPLALQDHFGGAIQRARLGDRKSIGVLLHHRVYFGLFNRRRLGN